MKSIRIPVLVVALASGFLLHAADDKAAKAKPYPLDFCLISDEKFEGSGMTPYEMAVDGQTIKFCCKSCLKDFNKDTKKYLKKLEEETKKAAKK
jgi:YHS domain-containing protein